MVTCIHGLSHVNDPSKRPQIQNIQKKEPQTCVRKKHDLTLFLRLSFAEPLRQMDLQ